MVSNEKIYSIMPEELPLVSIICISMNHAKYVKQSFDSVVAQTYKNIEIIYVDNNSLDNSFEISNEIFLNSGLPYKGFKREKNYSVSENLNFLIKKSSGKYLAPQSGDDWWDITNIEEKVKYYILNPDYGLIYCNGYTYYENTNKLTLPNTSNYKSGYIFDKILLEGIYFPIGYIMRKDIFDVIGLYDEDIMIDDWDIWLRILQHYPIGYFNVPLVYYRRHATTFSFTTNYKEHRIDSLKTLNKYKDHPLYKKAYLKNTEGYIYGIACRQHDLEVLKEIIRLGKPNWFYFKQVFKFFLKNLRLYKTS